jgi:hypothetical protein
MGLLEGPVNSAAFSIAQFGLDPSGLIPQEIAAGIRTNAWLHSNRPHLFGEIEAQHILQFEGYVKAKSK